MPAALLRSCNLTHANLSHANLSGADLSGANLYWARLHRIVEEHTKWDGSSRHLSRGTDKELAEAEDHGH